MSDKDRELPAGGQTMQIDALVDDFEEVEVAHSLPPPLPPKKTSKLAWVLGVFVVLLAAGLGIGAGFALLGGLGDEPAQQIAAPPTRRPVPPAVEEREPEAPSEPAEPAADVVQMDEVVFGAEE